MRAVAFALGLLLGCFSSSAAVSADEPAKPERRPLFNGQNLEGWEHIGPGKFVVEDGVLKTEGGMGLLWFSQEKLGNCVIRVVFKTSDNGDNSGVYIRIAEKPDDPWYAVHHGYEVQISDGGNPNRRTGSVYSFSPAQTNPAKPPGEWNSLEITLDGPLVQTVLNGEKVADFDPSGPVPDLGKRGGMGDPEAGPRPESGYIGLQNHDDDSVVYFKEITVRPMEE